MLLGGRDPERLAATRDAIERTTGNGRLRTYVADLASLDDVRAMADAVVASTERLDVLVNNAGIGSGRPDATTRQESRDGHELRFAVNFLAGALLTLRLLDCCADPRRRGSSTSPPSGSAPAGLRRRDAAPSYSGTRAYAQSKLAQITCGLRARRPARRRRRHRDQPAPRDVHAHEDRPRAGRSLGRQPADGRGARPSGSPWRPSSRASPAGSSTARARHGRTTRPTTRTPAGACGTSTLALTGERGPWRSSPRPARAGGAAWARPPRCAARRP